MAVKGPSPDEPLYVISVAARMVDLHPQTLRHYERLGLLEPARTSGDIRMYSRRDIDRVRKIRRLIDDLGVNLAGVEVILNMSEQIEELREQVEELELRVVEVAQRTARRSPAALEDNAAPIPLLSDSSGRSNR